MDDWTEKEGYHEKNLVERICCLPSILEKFF